MSALSPRVLAVALALGAGGVAMRLVTALRYPADWGFDASFNWRYIYALTKSWALPDPAAGWSAADPPLFFYVSAGVLRVGRLLTEHYYPLVVVPLLSVAVGLGSVALAFALVRRLHPDDPRRALLAAGLLLYLPAHVHMSVMVNEEIFATFFTSFAVLLLATRRTRDGLVHAGATGLAAGLALLTKLSGALTVLTTAATFAADGLRRRALGPAVARVATALLVAALAGGWYFARNRIVYGYFQPYGMPAHQQMFEMPPGERSLRDYVAVPIATWTDPQLLNPDLLHSVWGSTYVTAWFDGHRFFLPVDSEAVRRLGTLTLLLALLPTAAFASGLGRGALRGFRDPTGPDTPLVLLCALTLAGYALYTWQNPWFVVLKGTSLLGLSLPFAYYASGELGRWTRGRAAPLVWTALAALVAAVVLSCTYNLAFPKLEVSGLDWKTGS